MNNDRDKVNELVATINNACGELDEAARLSRELFSGADLSSILRELGRLMALIDDQVLPIVRRVYGVPPEIDEIDGEVGVDKHD